MSGLHFVHFVCRLFSLNTILVEAKTKLGFRYASISTELLLFVVSNHNSWVLASNIA
jgi:hypothetical protein